MEFLTISTGSVGNCYVLKDDAGNVLILDAGVHFDDIMKAVNFRIDAICGVLVTHEHGDHIKCADECLQRGINVYMTSGTAESLKEQQSNRLKIIQKKETYKIGPFSFQALAVDHDVKDPVCFLIHHHECGKILYLTDSKEIKYNFSGVQHLIVEANYCEEILEDKMNSSGINLYLGNRVLNSHFSIQKLIKVLNKWDLSTTLNIILIHLSDRNSDAKKFIRLVQGNFPAVSIEVADAGFYKKLNSSIW